MMLPSDTCFVFVLLFSIQPNLQSKTQKEGAEADQFWSLLGGRSEYPSQKIVREQEGDPHLFSCTFSKGKMKRYNLIIFIDSLRSIIWNSVILQFG